MTFSGDVPTRHSASTGTTSLDSATKIVRSGRAYWRLAVYPTAGEAGGVIPSFVLLGAFLGASVGIWMEMNRYAIGFFGLCIGATVGWVFRSKRRQQDSRGAKGP